MLKLQFKDRRQEAVWLVDPGLTIGRDKVSGLVIDEEGVNGFHADLRVAGEEVVIEAVGGQSATWVNGELITGARTLVPGDQLRIGKAEMLVVDPKDQTSQGGEKPPPGEASAAPEPAADAAAAGTGPAASGEQPALPPDASAWALRAETGPLAGKLFALDGHMILGRALQCEISIPEARLSREHASLTVADGGLTVADMGSSNGTFHNGERVAEARLKHGDSVAFDTLRFKVIGPANDMDRTVLSMAPAQVAGAAEAAPPEPEARGGGVPGWVWLLVLVAVAGGAGYLLL